MNAKEQETKPRRWSLFSKSLSAEVEQLVKPVFKAQGFAEHRILTQWDKIVGADLAAGSVPKKLTFPKGQRENGTLHVTVASGARALELQHMQPMILERIAMFFGYRAISRVVFLQDATLNPAPKRRRKVAQQQADAGLQDLVSACNDEELKNSLLLLGMTLNIHKQS